MKFQLHIYLFTLLFAIPGMADSRLKLFKSQKGKPLKRVQHEFLLNMNTPTELTLSDGNFSADIRGHYRYSFNRNLQFEARLALQNSKTFDGTVIGGGAIYNFTRGRLGQRYFAGGGALLYSGDHQNDSVVYVTGGKRFPISRHISLSPYAELTLPSNNDVKASLNIYPLSVSALF